MDLMGFGEMVQDCHKYEWIIFTSPNGVEAFFTLFFKLYKDARDIGAARIVAIGPGTAKKDRGVSSQRGFYAGKVCRRHPGG